jgi:hypothetical protein
MSTYLSRIKGAVSSVASTGAHILSGISSVASSSSLGRNSSDNAVPPKVELTQLYEEFCSIVDDLASLPSAESIEADIKLSQSNARPILRRIITLLQYESELWVEHQKSHIQFHTIHPVSSSTTPRIAASPSTTAESPQKPSSAKSKSYLEDIEIPCLEHVLQSNMIQGIINRALTDTPRGLMPLVLTAISHLLRSIDYPLLPHQSVYKSVSKLILFASKYEAVVQFVRETFDEEQYASYRRRIGT